MNTFVTVPSKEVEVDGVRVQVHTDGTIFKEIKVLGIVSWERMRPYKIHNGHMCVHIHNNKHVSRIVAAAFVPNPYGYKYVGHIDGNLENNHADNLYWCTASCIHNVASAKRKHMHVLTKDNISTFKENMMGEYNMQVQVAAR